MDAAGARALARRIEEQKAREAAQSGERSAPAVSYTPISGHAPPAPARAVRRSRSDVEIVHVPARAQPTERDIRMYTREIRHGIVDGREAVVTTIRCQALVEGRWQSRIVEVIIDRSGSSDEGNRGLTPYV